MVNAPRIEARHGKNLPCGVNVRDETLTVPRMLTPPARTRQPSRDAKRISYSDTVDRDVLAPRGWRVWVTTNVRYVRVKVRYPSPTAHFASVKAAHPDSRALGAASTPCTVYILHDYTRTTTTTTFNEIITEDTTPMSDRYKTQPKIASGLQQSAHKGLSHPTTLCATPA